jgi:TRAP transporter solute receptor, TAXI family
MTRPRRRFVSSLLNRAYRAAIAVAILAMCSAPVTCLAAAAPDLTPQLISVDTGTKNGVYYLVGGEICELVNAGRFEHGLRCLTNASDGSLANLRTVRRGGVELALAQSDLQYQAYRGSGVFKEAGRDANLRSVFSLYTEPFTVLARRDAGIGSFDDLKGKRVNVGSPGSGQRGTLESVLTALGWTMEDFTVASELGPEASAKAVCDGDVDAAIFTVGHPDQSISDAIKACGAILVPLGNDLVDRVLAAYPYYQRVTIGGGTYASNLDEINTFGVVATLVTSAQVSADVIAQVVRSVFENFDAFRATHPALKELDRGRMTHVGLAAPLHAGAVRYYREAGLLPH